MFSTLHDLAKKATLMITVAAEGDGHLRVNVTPMPADSKAKSNLPQPLSLLATPIEFDAEFIAALSTWQAPKRSLIQQAQDAAGGAGSSAPALPAPKSEPKSDSKADKAPRKTRGAGKGGDDDKKGGDAVPGAAAAAGEAAVAADQVMAETADTNKGEQQPAGAADATTSTEPGAAVDDGAAQQGAAERPDMQAEAAPSGAEAAGQAALDVYTLDMF